MKTVYFEKVKHMLAEMFAMKKRKAMNKALNVLTFIVTLPFFLAFLVAAVILLGLVLVFEILETPAKYLDEFLNERGAEVKTATQVVMYFFAWPVVFAMKALIAIVTLFMNGLYVAVVVLGYVWTLGGVKFHLSILEEGYEIEEVEKISKGRPLGLMLPTYIVGFVAVLLLVAVFVFPMITLKMADGNTIDFFSYLCALVAPLFGFKYEAAVVQFFAWWAMVIGGGLLGAVEAYIAVYVPLAFNNARK